MASSSIVTRSEEFLDQLTNQDSESEYAPWAQSQKMRLSLWAAKLGVFASGALSIEYRLRKNEVAAQAILQLLDALVSNLRLLTRDTSGMDSDSDTSMATDTATDIDRDEETSRGVLSPLSADDEITTYLDEEPHSAASSSVSSKSSAELNESNKHHLRSCVAQNLEDLLRYASIIRQYNVARTRRKGEDYDPSSDSESTDDDNDNDDNDEAIFRGGMQQLPISARFRSYVNMVLQEELGPHRFGDINVSWLKERLENAMMRRWRRLCYQHKRAKNRSGNSRLIRSSAPVAPTAGGLARSTNENAHPSGRDREEHHEATRLHKAGSLVSGATTFQSKATISGVNRPRTNSAKSASRVGAPDLSLPKVPRVEVIHRGFLYDCPYCEALPILRKPMNRSSWKSHLWDDLTPYVCLHQDCAQPEVEYASSHVWLEHMRTKHWQPVWVCTQCSDEAAVEGSEQELRHHISHTHDSLLSPMEVSLIARYSRRDFMMRECPVCGLEQGIAALPEPDLLLTSSLRQQNLVSCMLSHLEVLALGSLPWHLSHTDDAISNEAEGSEHVATMSNEAHADWEMDEVETSGAGYKESLGVIAQLASQEGPPSYMDSVATWKSEVASPAQSDFEQVGPSYLADRTLTELWTHDPRYRATGPEFNSPTGATTGFGEMALGPRPPRTIQPRDWDSLSG